MKEGKKRIIQQKSLKNKVLMYLLPIVIVGQIALGIIGITSIEKFGKDAIQNDLSNGHNTAIASIDEYFWGIEFRLNTLSKTGIIQDAVVANDPTNINKILVGIKGATDVIMSTVFRSDNLDLIIPSDLDYNSKGLNHVIEDEYYNKVLKDGILWVGPYDDKLSGNKALSVYVPVNDENEKTIGVLGMNINFDDMSIYFGEKTFSKTGYSLLLTTDGNLISEGTDKTNLHKPVANTDIMNITLKDGPDSGIIKLDGEKYYYKAETDSRSGWKVISLISTNEHKDVSNEIIILVIVVVVITLVVAIILIVMLVKKLVERLKKIVELMQKAGTGDLVNSIGTYNEGDEISLIGNSFNTMLEDFSKVILDTKNTMESLKEKNEELNKAIVELNSSSVQISDTMQQIAEVSNEQATETDSVIRETEKLSDSIDEVSSSLTEINKTCGKLEETSKVGLNIVQGLVKSSVDTIRATESINTSINNVQESSKEIENIVTLINDISEMTNLLALNAAIEAARVGENGKGFAVVADEIRGLAEQSKEATSNIQTIINEMRNKIIDTVNNVNLVNKAIELQNSNVKETETSFENIYNGINNINKEIIATNTLNENMTDKKDNIVNSMQSLVAGIEETSASTEEITSYAEEQLAINNSVAELSKSILTLNDNLVSKIETFKEIK